MVKQITIYDIAKEAGVSGATVSRAISGKGYVSSDKKAQIMRLVKEYDFRPNTFAQNLKAGYSKTIGYIVPHIGNLYFSNVYYEFEKKASEKGYLTILLNSNGNYDIESKIFNSLMLNNVDGIVMMGGRSDAVNVGEERLREVQEFSKKIPFVMCGGMSENYQCTGVYTDDDKGVEMLLIHLKEKGYKKICFLGGTDIYFPSYKKKLSAYKYSKKLDLEVDVRWLTKDMFNYKAGFDSMKMILSEGNIPDVICGANDYAAIGAMNAAIQAGLKVPDDIAFAGFDDVEACVDQLVTLTSVNPKYEKFAKKAFCFLEKMIISRDLSNHKSVSIKPELIIRDSTSRASVTAKNK